MNNTTVEDNVYEQLVKRSFAKLNKIFYANMAFVPVSSLAIVTNTLVILMILKHQKLRIASQFLVSQLAIADWLVGVSYLGTAVKRLARVYYHIPEVNSQAACCAEMWLPYFSQTASITIALAIAVERLLATAAAVVYRNNTRRIVGCLASLAWLYALVESAWMFYGVSFEKLVANCILVTSITPRFHAFQSYNKLVLISLMMVFYTGVMISIKHQVNKARKQNKNIATVKKRIQVKVARMLAVTAVLYVVFQVITRVSMTMLNGVPAEVKGSTAPFIRLLIVVNSGVNFFIYIRLNSEYKEAFGVLIGNKTQVHTTATPATERPNAANRSRFITRTKQTNESECPGTNKLGKRAAWAENS